MPASRWENNLGRTTCQNIAILTQHLLNPSVPSLKDLAAESSLIPDKLKILRQILVYLSENYYDDFLKTYRELFHSDAKLSSYWSFIKQHADRQLCIKRRKQEENIVCMKF